MSDRRLPTTARLPTSIDTPITAQLTARCAADKLPRCVRSHMTQGST